MTKEEMERTVLEEFWRQNGPVGPNLEVIDNDDDVWKVEDMSLKCLGSFIEDFFLIGVLKYVWNS
jgi:hypothetical protein